MVEKLGLLPIQGKLFRSAMKDGIFHPDLFQNTGMDELICHMDPGSLFWVHRFKNAQWVLYSFDKKHNLRGAIYFLGKI